MKRKKLLKVIADIFFTVLILTTVPGCSLISFREIGYTTYPAEGGAVIPVGEAVYIEFSMPVEKEAAEKSIKIFSASETVIGDVSWEGERLRYQPEPALTRGKRYTFSFKGQVESEYGEIFSINTEIPFYAGTGDPPPVITDYLPRKGSDVTVTEPVIITFSKPIDRDSFIEGFTLSPSTMFDIAWNGTGEVAAITPVEQWEPLTYYKWQTINTIKDTTGIPLAYPVSMGFFTQADNTPPSVSSTGPGARIPGGFLVLPGDLNDLAKTDVILITFSEDVDSGLLNTAFTLIPPVKGCLHRIEEAYYAFIPEDGFDMNTEYTLKIDTGCEDTSGIAMSSMYETTFTPDIPVLLVTEIRNTPALTDFTPAGFNQPEAYEISYQLPDKNHSFTIVFSEAIDAAYREQVSGSITCKTYFPPGISTIDFALENAGWNVSGTELTLTWTGFKYSPGADEPYYYELIIPCGENGAANSAGSCLEEDIRILLEAPVL